MPLTDITIKSASPKEKMYRLFDGGGLYIQIAISGAKLWRFKYRIEGKEKVLSLGQYPALSLKEARKLALDAKNMLSKGVEPSSQKKLLVSGEARLFKTIASEWYEKKQTLWSNSHRKTVYLRVHKYILPAIGDLEVSTVRPSQILDFLRPIEKNEKFETTSRTLNICSQIFRYAVACDICASDPCRDLRGALTPSTSTPYAAITNPMEVGALLASIEDYNGYPVVRALLFWSALTFCRPGEVRRAEWSEIDFEAREWRIPAEKMKMRFEHRVPLATQAIELLNMLKELHLSDTWIFPSPRAGRPLSDVAVLAALRRMGYTKEEMCAHGFRAMASTCLNELGYRPDVIERQLAHGDRDKIRAVYNRAAYMDERRVMMQEWADYLDKLKADHFERCRLARQ